VQLSCGDETEISVFCSRIGLGTCGGGVQLFVTLKPIDRVKYFSTAWHGCQGPVVQLTHGFGNTSGRFSVAELIGLAKDLRRPPGALRATAPARLPWAGRAFEAAATPNRRLRRCARSRLLHTRSRLHRRAGELRSGAGGYPWMRRRKEGRR
jgi:hypothetical protein